LKALRNYCQRYYRGCFAEVVDLPTPSLITSEWFGLRISAPVRISKGDEQL
jgi:hypothetical protein